MDKSVAAAFIRKLANQYEGMVVAAEVLESLGSLEQTEREVRGRIERLREDEARAKLAVAAAVGEEAQVKNSAAVILTNANTRADEIRAEAEQTSSLVLDAAERSSKASAEAAAVEAARTTGKARADLKEIQAKFEEGNKAVAEITSQARSKSAELAEITAKIAAAQEKLRQFVSS